MNKTHQYNDLSDFSDKVYAKTIDHIKFIQIGNTVWQHRQKRFSWNFARTLDEITNISNRSVPYHPQGRIATTIFIHFSRFMFFFQCSISYTEQMIFINSHQWRYITYSSFYTECLIYYLDARKITWLFCYVNITFNAELVWAFSGPKLFQPL